MLVNLTTDYLTKVNQPMLRGIRAHVINQVLEFVAYGSGKGLEVTTAAVRAVLLDTPDDAHEEAVLVGDPAEVCLRKALHCALCQLICQLCSHTFVSTAYSHISLWDGSCGMN